MYYATGDGYRTSADFSRLGWMVGLGTEFDLGGNWSAKAEYDYIRFGSQTVTATDGETRLTSRDALNQVKVGLNYRFGGDGSARDGDPLFVKVPDVARIRDWRGVYIGCNIAAAIARTNNETLYPSWTATGGSGFANVGSLAASGASIGGQLGYRAQAGRVVYGVEAQGNWASLSGRNTSGLDADFYQSWTNRTKIDSVGVFTGQLGVTISDALFYVKGGAVVVSERSDLFRSTGNYFVPPDTFHPNQTTHRGSDSATVWGGAIGAGAEYGFSANWSAGIDYVHGFLGTRSYDMAAVNGNSVFATMRTRQSLDMVSLRVNYSFGAK
ncbi:MAG: outer membrane beta-barrel protein [Alphaproteobacteria bacterium]|nr:outer membrane beta-barrel protein [Alphaproteobacteria bacterium]